MIIVPQDKIDSAIDQINDLELLPLLYAVLERVKHNPSLYKLRGELKNTIHELEVETGLDQS